MVRCSIVGASETYWFVHPLLAEVLEAGLLPEERRALHGAFVEALDGQSVRPDAVEIERVVDLADHHYRAGHREEAYRWAVLGSEAAGRAGGAKEMLRLFAGHSTCGRRFPTPNQTAVTCCNVSGLRRTRRAHRRRS